MTITNPLISAATFLLREAETFSSPYEFSKLLDAAAPDSGLAKAWACSAVLLKNGEWKLVPSHDYVRVVGGSLQLKVFGGGTLAGRGYWHSSEWLETEVDKVWLGALVLPGGEGVAATFESATRHPAGGRSKWCRRILLRPTVAGRRRCSGLTPTRRCYR